MCDINVYVSEKRTYDSLQRSRNGKTRKEKPDSITRAKKLRIWMLIDRNSFRAFQFTRNHYMSKLRKILESVTKTEHFFFEWVRINNNDGYYLLQVLFFCRFFYSDNGRKRFARPVIELTNGLLLNFFIIYSITQKKNILNTKFSFNSICLIVFFFLANLYMLYVGISLLKVWKKNKK